MSLPIKITAPALDGNLVTGYTLLRNTTGVYIPIATATVSYPFFLIDENVRYRIRTHFTSVYPSVYKNYTYFVDSDPIFYTSGSLALAAAKDGVSGYSGTLGNTFASNKLDYGVQTVTPNADPVSLNVSGILGNLFASNKLDYSLETVTPDTDIIILNVSGILGNMFASNKIDLGGVIIG
jgi:hypothetical protein